MPLTNLSDIATLPTVVEEKGYKFVCFSTLADVDGAMDSARLQVVRDENAEMMATQVNHPLINWAVYVKENHV